MISAEKAKKIPRCTARGEMTDSRTLILVSLPRTEATELHGESLFDCRSFLPAQCTEGPVKFSSLRRWPTAVSLDFPWQISTLGTCEIFVSLALAD